MTKIIKSSERDKVAIRLTQILLKLNQGEKLDPHQLANEFKVTVRTIQRDLLERFAYLPLSRHSAPLGHLIDIQSYIFLLNSNIIFN